jgi:hypothetical protein
MENRVFSAYNLARGVPLNSKLKVADTGDQPLKLLNTVITGMGMDSTAALWLTPLHSIPAVPRVFPFDLIYLDKDYRVLETAEMGPGIDFPAFFAEVASALILPPDTLHRTHTTLGDRLIVCASNDLESLLGAAGAASPAPPQAADIKSSPAVAARSLAERPTTPRIELTPERPAPAVAVAAIDVEGSLRNTPATLGDDPPVARPSKDVAEAVLDRRPKLQPAIIEHHIDPEDLFSNWVISAPQPPIARSPRPEPPVAPPLPTASSAKTEVSDQALAPEPARQVGSKSFASRKSGPLSDSERPRSAVPDASVPPVQAKAKPAPEPAISEKKSKNAPQVKTEVPADTRTAIPQLPLASTFTTVPYGLWQVSMPTAIPPRLASQSPAAPPQVTSPSSNAAKLAKHARSSFAPPDISEPTAALQEPSAQSPRSEPQAALPSTLPKPKAAIESAAPPPSRPPEEEPPATSASAKHSTSPEAHKPGDFVANLQQKLQRAQQSRLTPFADTAPVDSSSSTLASPRLADQAPPPPSAPSRQSEAKAKSVNPPQALSRGSNGVRVSETRKNQPVAKSKAAPAPPPVEIRTEQSVSFRSRFKQWLRPSSSPSDRRRAARRYIPGMVAHYFTGGSPKPNEVADISMSGMYLITEDRWMPGTLIQMILQKPCAGGERKVSINVLSRIVRRASDGVAAEFVMPEALGQISHDIQPSQATDKFALARFL